MTEKKTWFITGAGRGMGADIAKAALAAGHALLTIADEEQPPLRFMAGADSVALAEQKVAALQHQIDALRELSTSLALDDLQPAATGS